MAHLRFSASTRSTHATLTNMRRARRQARGCSGVQNALVAVVFLAHNVGADVPCLVAILLFENQHNRWDAGRRNTCIRLVFRIRSRVHGHLGVQVSNRGCSTRADPAEQLSVVCWGTQTESIGRQRRCRDAALFQGRAVPRTTWLSASSWWQELEAHQHRVDANPGRTTAASSSTLNRTGSLPCSSTTFWKAASDDTSEDGTIMESESETMKCTVERTHGCTLWYARPSDN